MTTYYVAPRLRRWEDAFTTNLSQIPLDGSGERKATLAVDPVLLKVSPGFLPVYYRVEDLLDDYPDADPKDIVVIKEKD